MTLRDALPETRLPAVDLDRARAWYSTRLGLDPAEERDGGLRYVNGGVAFCLFASAGRSDGSFTQLAFTVDDVEASVAALQARGVVFEEAGIVDVPDNYPSKGCAERGAWFRDSEGNMIALGQAVRC